MLPHPLAASAGPLSMYGTLASLRARHNVTLATFAGPAQAERDAVEQLRASGVDVHAIWRSVPAGLDRWRWRWRLGSGWLRGTRPRRALEFLEPSMQRLLDHLFETRPFDVIQVEDNAMGGYHYPGGIPAVLTEHEVRSALPAAWPAEGPASILRSLLQVEEWRRWRRYQAEVWQRFDRVVVFTPRDAAALRALAPSVAPRLRVNPFGIDLPPAAEPAREAPDTVVFVGAFNHGPNVDAALWLGGEIMPLIWERRPGARLIVVGSQPTAAIRALAGDNIAVTGHVPEVGPYLEQAAVVLAPLRCGGGMRMKVLQAMALGKAVVATPLGAEGLAAAGRPTPLAIASSAREIAARVCDLLADPMEREELGRSARALVGQQYSHAAYRRRLEAIYAGLVPNGQGGALSKPESAVGAVEPAPTRASIGASAERLLGGAAQGYKIPILMYHQVAPDPPAAFRKYTVTPRMFAVQMRWLARARYVPVTLDALLEHRAGRRRLPARAVVITFDDGFADCARYAAPILERYGFNALFYLVAGLMGTASDWLAPRGLALPIMGWATARRLEAAGFVCASHTVTHPHLADLAPGGCLAELRDARALLEDRLGHAVCDLAYPYGSFNAAVRAVAAEAGYRTACSTRIGRSAPDDDILALHRIPVNGDESLLDFICRLRTTRSFGELRGDIAVGIRRRLGLGRDVDRR
jgi:peptidoglycan/xylan/chitin deacetylase (PgdA/CDA1 family)/glycosyltransferase involved in cell wall biosynthesis